MDGFSASSFHTKCDGHANTLTIIKAPETIQAKEFLAGSHFFQVKEIEIYEKLQQ